MQEKVFEKLLTIEKTVSVINALAHHSECSYEVAYSIVTGRAEASMKRVRVLMARNGWTMDETDQFIKWCRAKYRASADARKAKLGEVAGVRK